MKICIRPTLLCLLIASLVCLSSTNKIDGRWTDAVGIEPPSPQPGPPPGVGAADRKETSIANHFEALNRKNNRNPVNIRFRKFNSIPGVNSNVNQVVADATATKDAREKAAIVVTKNELDQKKPTIRIRRPITTRVNAGRTIKNISSQRTIKPRPTINYNGTQSDDVKKKIDEVRKIRYRNRPPTRTRGSKAGHVLTGRSGHRATKTKRGQRLDRQKKKPSQRSGTQPRGCPSSCPPPWTEIVSKLRGDTVTPGDPICEFTSMFVPCEAPGTVCRKDPVLFTCCPQGCIFPNSTCSGDRNTSGNVCLPVTLQPWIKDLMPVLSVLRRHA